jgi:hypothetical protein
MNYHYTREQQYLPSRTLIMGTRNKPATPNGSRKPTNCLVKRNGTTSGTGSNSVEEPNACPKSMDINLPLHPYGFNTHYANSPVQSISYLFLSIKKFSRCRSPIPRM